MCRRVAWPGRSSEMDGSLESKFQNVTINVMKTLLCMQGWVHDTDLPLTQSWGCRAWRRGGGTAACYWSWCVRRAGRWSTPRIWRRQRWRWKIRTCCCSARKCPVLIATQRCKRHTEATAGSHCCKCTSASSSMPQQFQSINLRSGGVSQSTKQFWSFPAKQRWRLAAVTAAEPQPLPASRSTLREVGWWVLLRLIWRATNSKQGWRCQADPCRWRIMRWHGVAAITQECSEFEHFK